MGHKIFVSYKYADDNVQPLPQTHSGIWHFQTTVRDYVDRLADYIDQSSHIYKGEYDNEDLSQYSDDQIWELLKDRIYDSSVTIVMVSPNMRVSHQRERDQWIPWEVSFSLRETTRNDRTSHTNAVLAIIVPDRNGKYDYYSQWLQSHRLWDCISTVNGGMFSILRKNMFNRKKTWFCMNGACRDEPSYIKTVRWDDFIRAPNHYIERAFSIKGDAECYDIQKEV